MDYNNLNNMEEFMKFCGCNFNETQNNNNTKSDKRSKNNSSKSKRNKNKNQSNENNSSGKQRRCENCKPNNGQGKASESVRYSDSDIPGGFQDIPPQLLLVIGELIGNIVAGNLPFNVQNVVGNWLQLVGQAIEVFNAQQQYFQGGPGRYYNEVYRNVANPFCTDETPEEQKSIVLDEDDKSGVNQRKNTISNKDNIVNSNNYEDEIKELKSSINNLHDDIATLKNQIKELIEKR